MFLPLRCARARRPHAWLSRWSARSQHSARARRDFATCHPLAANRCCERPTDSKKSPRRNPRRERVPRSRPRALSGADRAIRDYIRHAGSAFAQRHDQLGIGAVAARKKHAMCRNRIPQLLRQRMSCMICGHVIHVKSLLPGGFRRRGPNCRNPLNRRRQSELFQPRRRKSYRILTGEQYPPKLPQFAKRTVERTGILDGSEGNGGSKITSAPRCSRARTSSPA